LKETELAELLLTKFCHDMAGVIGAINNGLELMEEENAELKGQAVELLNFSAREALARLQFFRLIYGVSASESKIDFGELKSLIGKFYENAKVIPEYINQRGDDDFSLEKGKLLANLIYAASLCLPRGGKLAVDMGNFLGTGEVVISAENDHIKLDDELKKALDGGEIEPREKEIQPYYTALLARRMGYAIAVQKAEKFFEIRLEKLGFHG